MSRQKRGEAGPGYGLEKDVLLSTVPISLRRDSAVIALEAVVAEALATRLEEIDRVRIISNIDGLDEAVLDILAHDFKVDWYDPEYSLEEKRRTLKDNWLVHRRLGTKYAVRTALNAVYPGASVQEWFEYGGNPYCFRVVLPASGELTIEKQKRVLSRIQYYKNLRSHLDKIVALIEAAAHTSMAFVSHRIDFHTGTSIFGVQIIRLDGSRILDGSWTLGTEWARGAKFPKMSLRWGTGRMMGLYKAVGTRGRSFYLLGIRTQDGLRAREDAAPSCAYKVAVSAGAEAGASLSGELTTDSMWRLDDTYRLDGSRRLNADVVTTKL